MEEDQKQLSYSIGQKVFVATPKTQHTATVTGFEPAQKKVRVKYGNGRPDLVEFNKLTPLDELTRTRPRRSTIIPTVEWPKTIQTDTEVNKDGETDSVLSLFGDDDPIDDAASKPHKQKIYIEDKETDSILSLFGDDDSIDDNTSVETQESPSYSRRRGGGSGGKASKNTTSVSTGGGGWGTASGWARKTSFSSSRPWTTNNSAGGESEGATSASCNSSPSVGKKIGGGSPSWPTPTNLNATNVFAGGGGWGAASGWAKKTSFSSGRPWTTNNSAGGESEGATSASWNSSPSVGKKIGGGSPSWPTPANLPIEAVLGEGYAGPSLITYPPPFAKQKQAERIHPPASFGPPVTVLGEKPQDFLLKKLFEDRVLVKPVKLSRSDECTLEKQIVHDGQQYVLVCCKSDKDGDGTGIPTYSKFNGLGQVLAYYVRKDGKPSIASELSSIANFAPLPANKIAARLELLLTPACKAKQGKSKQGKQQPESCAWELDWSKFELVDDEDDKNMGCGFIPFRLLQQLVPGVFAVQVRIVCPEGIFKGMLMAKTGINKIQLFHSMHKVSKPLRKLNKQLKGKAFLLFRQTAPSTPATYMDRQLNPHLPNPPPSAERDLRELCSMLQDVLLMNGVQQDVMDRYLAESMSYDSRHHCAAYGVSDPTGKLPEGSIFLTGFGTGNVYGENKVFVSRFPCTERKDGRMLPLVRTQPMGMSDEDWNFLCSLHFGLIIFAVPQSPGARLLPQMIANGDLDGDPYIILWDKQILSDICEEPIFLAESENEDDSNDENDDTLDDSDEENYDTLVGVKLTHEVNGTQHHGTVKQKKGDGYLVAFKNLDDQVLTREQVTGDRHEYEITDHRGRCRNIEVKIVWKLVGTETVDDVTWESISDAKNRGADVTEAVAQYAVNNNLTNTIGWGWAKKFIKKDVDALRILDHREVGGRVKDFKVLYDDGEHKWEELSVHQPDDLDLIRKYVNETDEDVLQKRSWSGMKERITNSKRNWFKELQEYLLDLDSRIDHQQLRSTLHRLFNKNSIDEKEKLHFGRAFKQSLDIAKHGGKVDLPSNLRVKVPKGLRKYINM